MPWVVWVLLGAACLTAAGWAFRRWFRRDPERQTPSGHVIVAPADGRILDVREVDPNELTLVMELAEGKLKGHITGQYGTLTESPLTDIALEGSVFSFQVMAAGPGGGELAVTFKMEVDIKNGSMKGTLEIPDMGMTGTWEASKQ